MLKEFNKFSLKSYIVLFLVVAFFHAKLFSNFCDNPFSCTDTQKNSYSPQLVMNNVQQALAAWIIDDNIDTTLVQTSVYSGGVWGSTRNLSIAGVYCYDPRIDMNDAGDGVAVWRRYDPTNCVIEVSLYTGSQDTWSAPVVLSTTGAVATDARVVMNSSGNILVVWSEIANNSFSIRSAYYVKTTGEWSFSENLAPSNQYLKYPDVAMNDNNQAVAVWAASSQGSMEVQAAAFTDGNWRVSQTILRTPITVSPPSVGIDASGNAMAVFMSYQGGDFPLIQSASYTINGWSAPQTLRSDVVLNFSKPQFAMNGSGNAVLGWGEYEETTSQVNTMLCSQGEWSVPTLLSTGSIGSVSINTGGNAVASWNVYDGTSSKIQGALWSGSSWSLPLDIYEYIPPENGPIPSLVYSVDMDDNSTSGCAWTSYNGVFYSIQTGFRNFP